MILIIFAFHQLSMNFARKIDKKKHQKINKTMKACAKASNIELLK